MRLDDLPESGNVEDRRGEEGGGRGGLSLGGGGGLGIGTVVVLGLIGWALGIDPRLLIGGAEMVSGGSNTNNSAPTNARRTTGSPTDEAGRNVSRILGSTEAVWKDVFARDGKTYRAPVLVLYRDQTDASCGGPAQKSMGPFYCPVDQKVYLDTSFFRELETRFGGCSGKACQFSQAYVIAHEVGHHVQNLLGVLPRAQQAQQSARSKADANAIQVRVELQADCLAGVWAKRENDLLVSQGKPEFVEPGDVPAALRTAAAIGDDTLQKRAQGYAVPDSFTHGTSEQRQRWVSTGLQQGTVASCNTFGASNI
jgi:predicted metalloprotease